MPKSDFPNARAAFEQALELQPAYLAAIANLVRLDLADKKPDAARKRFNASARQGARTTPACSSLTLSSSAASGAPSKEVGAQLEKAVDGQPHVRPGDRRLDRSLQPARRSESRARPPRSGAGRRKPGRTRRSSSCSAWRSWLRAKPNQALSTFNRLAALLPQSPGPQRPDRRGLSAGEGLVGRDRGAEESAGDSAEVAGDKARSCAPAPDGRPVGGGARGLPAAWRRSCPRSLRGYVLEGDLFAAQKKWPEAETAYREALGRANRR